jgi:hypothetical protein
VSDNLPMVVPNWGLDSVRVYLNIDETLSNWSKKTHFNYDVMKSILKKKHAQIYIKYNTTAKILNKIIIMADDERFSRFINKGSEEVYLKWRGQVFTIIPFEYYEVSAGIIGFMEFKKYNAYKSDIQIFDKYMGFSHPFDIRFVYDELAYLFNHKKADPGEFNDFLDYWVERLVTDLDMDLERRRRFVNPEPVPVGKWSKDEIKILKDNLGLTMFDLGKKLGRNHQMITMKMIKLGLMDKRKELVQERYKVEGYKGQKLEDIEPHNCMEYQNYNGHKCSLCGKSLMEVDKDGQGSKSMQS